MSTVKSSIHNNLSQKQALCKQKHCSNPRNFKMLALCFNVELFQNNDVTISLNTNPMLRFQFSPMKYGRKPFDVFSEWLTSFSNFSVVVRMPFRVNAYTLHGRLQIDLPQVDFSFYKMKSTCSVCSDSNLKSGCDVMIHSLHLIPWSFFKYSRASVSREINHMPSN